MKDKIIKAGERQGCVFEEHEVLDDKRQYAKFELPDGKQLACFPKGRFNNQFGREVMSEILDVKERMNWKECVISDAQEQREADVFKKAFAPFDFSLE